MSKRIANRTRNLQNRLSSTIWLASFCMTEDAEKHLVDTYKKLKLLFVMLEKCPTENMASWRYEPLWCMKKGVLEADSNIRKVLSRQGYVTIRCVEFQLRYAQQLLSKYDLL